MFRLLGIKDGIAVVHLPLNFRVLGLIPRIGIIIIGYKPITGVHYFCIFIFFFNVNPKRAPCDNIDGGFWTKSTMFWLPLLAFLLF